MAPSIVRLISCFLTIQLFINCFAEAQYFAPNGRTPSSSASNSLSNDVNVGNLGLSSTLTRNRASSGGQYSGGVSHGLGLGPLGISSSLSTDNLSGPGLRRNHGGLGVGLGPLGLDLCSNRGVNAETAAGAYGDYTNAESQAGSRGLNVGPLGLNSAYSNSQASGFGGNSVQTTTAETYRKVYGNTAGPTQLNKLYEHKKFTLGTKMLAQQQKEAEQRTFNNFFDMIIRIMSPTMQLASQAILPTVTPSTPTAYSPQSCCNSCNMFTSCSSPGAPQIQGNVISYASASASASSSNQFGPYNSVNAQSGVQVG